MWPDLEHFHALQYTEMRGEDADARCRVNAVSKVAGEATQVHVEDRYRFGHRAKATVGKPTIGQTVKYHSVVSGGHCCAF